MPGLGKSGTRRIAASMMGSKAMVFPFAQALPLGFRY
jgi:hypothetical protein